MEFRPHLITSSLLRNIKDKIYLKEQGLYDIPYSNCHHSYWGRHTVILVKAEEKTDYQ